MVDSSAGGYRGMDIKLVQVRMLVSVLYSCIDYGSGLRDAIDVIILEAM